MADHVTEQRAQDIYRSTCRWGRWGDDDQRGALNLITHERVVAAASLVREGWTVPCGRPLAVTPEIDNPSPALHHMLVAGDVGSHRRGSADFIAVACHGMVVSHIDAFCHVINVDGLMYNGRPRSEILSTGARSNALDVTFSGVVGRGVLLDLPKAVGRPWLEPGETIEPADLDSARARQEVTPAPGDLLLIATGRDARRAEYGPWSLELGLAGLDPECIPWLAEWDPAVLGSDGVSDPLPANSHRWAMPVHQCLISGMGVHLLDNLNLSGLAEACARLGRWEFLFTVEPLQISGGTGSPVNPIAVL